MRYRRSFLEGSPESARLRPLDAVFAIPQPISYTPDTPTKSTVGRYRVIASDLDIKIWA